MGSLFPRATSQVDMLACAVPAQIPVQNIQKFTYSVFPGKRVGRQGLQRLGGIQMPAVFDDRADITLDAAEMLRDYVEACGRSTGDCGKAAGKIMGILESEMFERCKVGERIRRIRGLMKAFNGKREGML